METASQSKKQIDDWNQKYSKVLNDFNALKRKQDQLDQERDSMNRFIKEKEDDIKQYQNHIEEKNA